ncbi:hypothetical protein MLD38_026658 [Melastoma candidum]|uniref:Uncharacterized protein n=1 Tax=Melastoma candidum TaxID=119954 RepID=A0ACB9P2S7_9MYRT|nr:hypothetical protein MLD38_026658 [Melastoma candidum]
MSSNQACLRLSPYQTPISILPRTRIITMSCKARQVDSGSGSPLLAGDGSRTRVPHVMTVAGSDSGAGAGIQADLKACGARGVYCSTVITAVTAQNTVGVQGVHIVPEEFLAQQLDSVMSDMEVDVVKTGMLPSKEIVRILCRALDKAPVRALVVDPVMVSTSGDVLAGPAILTAFREELLPVADLITPNLKEASALLDGIQVKTVADMCSAAKLLHQMGPRHVLVKGGDLPGSFDAVDVYFDGKEIHELHSARVRTKNTHGTGCTLASSIAAEVAKGSSMLPAIKASKQYVETSLLYSKDISIGNGPQGPFDHFLRLKGQRQQPFDPNVLFLYAVTDSGMNSKWNRPIANAVREAIEGGATIVQLREKHAETRDFIEMAKSCMEICRSKGVPLLINDRVDIALACDADGVHVGQSDMPVRTARSILGPEKIIGVSCKTTEQAQQAWLDGADYIGCGGIYPTNTKENNITVGLDGLKAVCLSTKLPVVAIGGIGISNAPAVMKLRLPNLKGVAVVSALFDRECITGETKRLQEALTIATAYDS